MRRGRRWKQEKGAIQREKGKKGKADKKEKERIGLWIWARDLGFDGTNSHHGYGI